MERRKTLDILIGDDLFGIFLDLIKIENKYLNPLKEILSRYYDMNIILASNPEQMIKEVSKGVYDLIITDLDYQTTGRAGTEGFDILDSISEMVLAKKPFKILSTSADNKHAEIEKRITEGKIDAYISAGSHTKFQNLVDFILNKYSSFQIESIERLL